MFGVEQAALVLGLIALNAAHCGYARSGAVIPAARCDCKYGIRAGVRPGDEQNGCPELRMASLLIAALTPMEFSRACKRAGVHGAATRTAPSKKRKRKAALPGVAS